MMTPDELVERARAALADYQDALRDHLADPTSDEKRTRRHARWKLARDLLDKVDVEERTAE